MNGKYDTTGTQSIYSNFPRNCAARASSAQALGNTLKPKDGTQDAEASETRVQTYAENAPEYNKRHLGAATRVHRFR
jgi:hypothetical protein